MAKCWYPPVCSSNVPPATRSGKLKVATPSRLLAAVYHLAPQFAGFDQQDAQEVLHFLISQTTTENPKARERLTKLPLAELRQQALVKGEHHP